MVSEFYVQYDYGTIRQMKNLETNEFYPVVSVLYNYSELGFDVNNPEYNLIPGDKLIIDHTGEMICLMSMPGRLQIVNGCVKDSKYEYSKVIKLDKTCFRYDNNRLSSFEGFVLKTKHIVIDKEGRFITIEGFMGDELYASTIDGKNIEALFTFNPRR